MATFNLTITYPDGEQTRILTALKAHYASNGTPNPTNAQAIESLRLDVAANIRQTVLAYEQAAAQAAVIPVTPT